MKNQKRNWKVLQAIRRNVRQSAVGNLFKTGAWRNALRLKRRMYGWRPKLINRSASANRVSRLDVGYSLRLCGVCGMHEVDYWLLLMWTLPILLLLLVTWKMTHDGRSQRDDVSYRSEKQPHLVAFWTRERFILLIYFRSTSCCQGFAM